MPWQEIFFEDFDTPVAEGSFPGPVYSAKFGTYPDGTPDTWSTLIPPGDPDVSGYYASEVLSVSGGALRKRLHVDGGIAKGGIVIPLMPGTPPYDPLVNGGYPQVNFSESALLEGRYSIRWRIDAPTNGWKVAWLLWPETEAGPPGDDGEIDFPEGDFEGNIAAFMHWQGDGSSQDAFSTSTPMYASGGAWYTTTIERTANYVRFYLDGVLVGESTTSLPVQPMTWRIQTETSFPNDQPVAGANVEIDWIRVEVPSAAVGVDIISSDTCGVVMSASLADGGALASPTDITVDWDDADYSGGAPVFTGTVTFLVDYPGFLSLVVASVSDGNSVDFAPSCVTPGDGSLITFTPTNGGPIVALTVEPGGAIGVPAATIPAGATYAVSFDFAGAEGCPNAFAQIVTYVEEEPPGTTEFATAWALMECPGECNLYNWAFVGAASESPATWPVGVVYFTEMPPTAISQPAYVGWWSEPTPHTFVYSVTIADEWVGHGLDLVMLVGPDITMPLPLSSGPQTCGTIDTDGLVEPAGVVSVTTSASPGAPALVGGFTPGDAYRWSTTGTIPAGAVYTVTVVVDPPTLCAGTIVVAGIEIEPVGGPTPVVSTVTYGYTDYDYCGPVVVAGDCGTLPATGWFQTGSGGGGGQAPPPAIYEVAWDPIDRSGAAPVFTGVITFNATFNEQLGAAYLTISDTSTDGAPSCADYGAAAGMTLTPIGGAPPVVTTFPGDPFILWSWATTPPTTGDQYAFTADFADVADSLCPNALVQLIFNAAYDDSYYVPLGHLAWTSMDCAPCPPHPEWVGAATPGNPPVAPFTTTPASGNVAAVFGAAPGWVEPSVEFGGAAAMMYVPIDVPEGCVATVNVSVTVDSTLGPDPDAIGGCAVFIADSSGGGFTPVNSSELPDASSPSYPQTVVLSGEVTGPSWVVIGCNPTDTTWSFYDLGITVASCCEATDPCNGLRQVPATIISGDRSFVFDGEILLTLAGLTGAAAIYNPPGTGLVVDGSTYGQFSDDGSIGPGGPGAPVVSFGVSYGALDAGAIVHFAVTATSTAGAACPDPVLSGAAIAYLCGIVGSDLSILAASNLVTGGSGTLAIDTTVTGGPWDEVIVIALAVGGCVEAAP